MVHINLVQLGNVDQDPRWGQFPWDITFAPRAPRTGKARYSGGDQPHAMTKRPNRSPAETDAAWLFLSYMSGPEVMVLIAEQRGSIPVHRKVLNGDRYLRQPPPSVRQIPKMIDDLQFSVPWFRGRDEWWTAIRTPLLAGLRGEMAPDDALRQATMDGDAILAQFAGQG